MRSRVVTELAALWALRAEFAAEDTAHDEEQLQAHREDRKPKDDRRTPTKGRKAATDQIVARVWAGVIVLAEVVDAVQTHIREHATELLDERRLRLDPAAVKRQEAARLLEEARVDEWLIAQNAMWVRKAIGPQSHGAQPAPVPELPPKNWSEEPVERALKIPFHEVEDGPPMVAHIDNPANQVSEPGEEATPVGGDPTGLVSALDEPGAHS
jgi:hypothetical protein